MTSLGHNELRRIFFSAGDGVGVSTLFWNAIKIYNWTWLATQPSEVLYIATTEAIGWPRKDNPWLAWKRNLLLTRKEYPVGAVNMINVSTLKTYSLYWTSFEQHVINI